MKVILLSILALICYSIASVLIKHKLPTNYSTSMIQCITYGLMITLAVSTRLHEMRVTPSATNSTLSWGIFLVIIATGLLYFVADYSYFTALTEKGSVVVIMVILALIPCVAGLVEYPFTKIRPHWLEVVGVLLGVLAVFCVTSDVIGSEGLGNTC